jgi:ribulose-phosphate 3-epimerase
MPSIQVAPSILSADFSRLGEELADLEAAGADVVHVDVMDGHFVPNLTVGPPVVSALRERSRLPFDVHLMIENADRWVEAYREAGADWISVHAEAVPHLHRCLSRIAELGAKPGVALNPGTPLSALDEVLPLCHHVLLMSVNPGFGGQSFIVESVDKARRFIVESVDKARRLRETIEGRGLATLIEMDGGLAPETVGEPVEAGVSVVVAGSAVLGRPDRRAAVAALRDACTR